MTNIQMAVLALDILLFAYYYRFVLDLLVIWLQSVYIFSNLARWTLQDLHSQIGHCLSTVSWKPRAPLARHSSHYFRNHHRTSGMIAQLDHHFTSDVIFAAVLMNIVFNAYSLSTFVLRPDSVQLLDHLILLWLVLVEGLLAVVIIYPMLYTNRLLRQTAHLHRVQLMLTRESIGCKIKFLIQYEQLHTADGSGFTFGPMGTLSSHFVLQVEQTKHVAKYLNFIIYHFTASPGLC